MLHIEICIGYGVYKKIMSNQGTRYQNHLLLCWFQLTKIDYADDEEEEEVKEVSPPVKMEAPLLVDVEQENSQVSLRTDTEMI